MKQFKSTQEIDLLYEDIREMLLDEDNGYSEDEINRTADEIFEETHGMSIQAAYESL